MYLAHQKPEDCKYWHFQAELDINSKLSFVYQITFIDNPKGRGRPIADKVQIDLVRNTPQGSLF